MCRVEQKPKRPYNYFGRANYLLQCTLMNKMLPIQLQTVELYLNKGGFYVRNFKFGCFFYTHCYSLSQILTEREQYVMQIYTINESFLFFEFLKLKCSLLRVVPNF